MYARPEIQLRGDGCKQIPFENRLNNDFKLKIVKEWKDDTEIEVQFHDDSIPLGSTITGIVSHLDYKFDFKVINEKDEHNKIKFDGSEIQVECTQSKIAFYFSILVETYRCINT